MGCDTMSTEGWLQISAGHNIWVFKELVDHYIAGLFEDREFVKVLQRHRNSLGAIAYSCAPQNEELFAYELEQAVWPHVYLHPNSIQRQTHASKIAQRLHALVDEWFPFSKGGSPTFNKHRCERYPSHEWLSQHVEGYHTALFFTSMNYETLCNAWAPGLEGIANHRAALFHLATHK